MPYQNPHSPKCHGPRVLSGYSLHGSQVIVLENELLRVVINVGRGAMVHEFLYKPADLDVLYKNPNGLRGVDSFAPSSYDTPPLVDHHPGGWYECFPNGGEAGKIQEANVGFHGEVWGLKFELNSVGESASGCSATMTALTVRTPFKLVKTFALKKNDPTLYLEETATNLGAIDLRVHWGQHPMLGAPFLDEKCRIETSATGFFDAKDEPMIRLRWPERDGVDLSRVRGPESREGKMVFVTDFDTGKYRIVSPTWHLAFEMVWDAETFPYCWLYENAGQVGAPWFGRMYALALEPFTGLPNALSEGHGLLDIPAGKSETVRFDARIVAV